MKLFLRFAHSWHCMSVSRFSHLVRAASGEGVRRLLGVLCVELAHLPPPVVSGGQLVSPEHRPPGDSSPLPSPLLFFSRLCSLMMGGASRWWWLFCPAVLLFVLSRWVLLGMIVYGSILYSYRPRPE